MPVLPDPAQERANATARPAAAAQTSPLRAAAPLYAKNPPPAYPESARRNGWSGEVVVRVGVDAGGEVTSTGIESSSGYPVLDQAALTAVRKWRFLPAHRGAQALAGEVLVPIRFRLARPQP